MFEYSSAYSNIKHLNISVDACLDVLYIYIHVRRCIKSHTYLFYVTWMVYYLNMLSIRISNNRGQHIECSILQRYGICRDLVTDSAHQLDLLGFVCDLLASDGICSQSLNGCTCEKVRERSPILCLDTSITVLQVTRMERCQKHAIMCKPLRAHPWINDLKNQRLKRWAHGHGQLPSGRPGSSSPHRQPILAWTAAANHHPPSCFVTQYGNDGHRKPPASCGQPLPRNRNLVVSGQHGSIPFSTKQARSIFHHLMLFVVGPSLPSIVQLLRNPWLDDGCHTSQIL